MIVLLHRILPLPREAIGTTDWIGQVNANAGMCVRSAVAQQAATPATLARVTPSHSMPTASGPISAADGAPMSVSPGDSASPSPQVKIPAVKPKSAQAITATTNKIVQRSVNEGNTAPPMFEAPALRPSTLSQTSAQAPAAPVAWPNAPAAVAAVKAPTPIAVPTDAPANLASDDAETTGKPTNNVGMPDNNISYSHAWADGSWHSVHEYCRTRVARGPSRTTPSPTGSTINASMSGADGQHGSVDEQREYQSLVSAVSDPFRAEGDADQNTHEISKRRDKLAQLHQDLDRLLQSPTVA